MMMTMMGSFPFEYSITTWRRKQRTYFGILCVLVLVWNVFLYDDTVIFSPLSIATTTTTTTELGDGILSYYPSIRDKRIFPNSTKTSSLLLWPLSDDDDNNGCNIAMRYIRQLNECRGDCAIAYNVSKPLLHWAVLGGQGIGRFIDNAVYTCLRAASLHRPCLVDTTVRDPFFTLRSFLHMPLDVDVEAEAIGNHQADDDDSAASVNIPWIFTKAEAVELLDAISRLHNPGSGHWTASDFASVESGDNNHPYYNHVLPLMELSIAKSTSIDINSTTIMSHNQTTTTMVEDILQNYDRIAISPSWGPPSFWAKDDARYESIPASSLNDNKYPRHQCRRDNEGIITQMQNYMFRPTRLSRELFAEYKRRVLGTAIAVSNNTTNNHNNMKEEDDDDKIIRYGSIHIRFHILRTTYKAFPQADTDDTTIQKAIYSMAGTLWKRMEKERAKHSKRLGNVCYWWVVSDNMEYSRILASSLNQLAGNSNSKLLFVTEGSDARGERSTDTETNADTQKMPPLPPPTDTVAILDRILAHRQSSSKSHNVIGSKEGTIHHSVDPHATGPLGHEQMATSIIDWMVLHESDAAVVTIGSFGATGARGHKKVPVNPDRAHYRFFLKF